MMFSKFSALAVLIPLASALTITTPTNWTSANTAVIQWTTSAGDPSTWSFELVNADQFHQSFGLANNVQPSLGSMTIELPVVPVGAGYTLEAVNITDINQVFATTGSFSIGATISTSSSSSASSTGSSTASASGSSGSSSGTSIVNPSTQTTTGFGTTLTGSTSNAQETGSGSSAAGSSSGSPSSSSSGSGAQPSSFNGNGNSSGAIAVFNDLASWAAMVFAAAIGGVVAL